MVKWLLRLIILLSILLIGSYFFRVEFGDGKVTISPRSASERAKFWLSWPQQNSVPPAPSVQNKPKPKAAEVKPNQAKPNEGNKKQISPPPVKPKDQISDKDKKALESILEKEL